MFSHSTNILLSLLCRLLTQTLLIYSIADPRLRYRFVRGYILSVCSRRLVVEAFCVTSVN
ncbi:MAG: hypothetical protein AUG51_11995 [Acidobacteria bacterium 13_1_20CM_3_53_8]|nr:MAG: hypothetical protein AUG51_11995 [Acidobacteria bacterium 13_1_20CM_3_53_8]